MEQENTTVERGPSQEVDSSVPPVSYNGVFLLLGMMALLFVGALTQGDLSRTFRLMGFRDPVTKAYTIMLTTPILFELLFNPLVD